MSDTIEKTVEEVKAEGKGFISRRNFLKGLGVTGASVALFTTGTRLLATPEQEPVSKIPLERDIYWPERLTREQLIEMQRKMLQIRWYDRTVADKMLTEKGFRGYMHGSPGHEACAVGACFALNKDDWMAGYHRSHHHAIAKGANIRKMAAEIIFKASGTNNGYGGSMHIMQADVGMLGEDGVVGPGCCYGAGAGHALRARGKGQVALTFGGDAHATTPYFHISLNEAATHKIPWVYVIENNQYLDARGQHISECINVDDIAIMATAYNIPGVVVDGMDVLDVYNAVKAAVERARAGRGPTLIECKTYRYYDHFGVRGAEPGKLGSFGLGYRSDRELLSWLARDPIDKHRKTLVQTGMLTEREADALEEEVKAEIRDAFRWAEAQPVPRAEDGLRHVFVEEESVLPRMLADCPPWKTYA